jgi:hypothetical protein
MIKVERLADGSDGSSITSPNGGLESIPGVVAPPVLAMGARNAARMGGGEMEEEADGEGGAEGEQESGGVTKKRKRNKPTLSCGECVERKTKVGVSNEGLYVLTSSSIPLLRSLWPSRTMFMASAVELCSSIFLTRKVDEMSFLLM